VTGSAVILELAVPSSFKWLILRGDATLEKRRILTRDNIPELLGLAAVNARASIESLFNRLTTSSKKKMRKSESSRQVDGSKSAFQGSHSTVTHGAEKPLASSWILRQRYIFLSRRVSRFAKDPPLVTITLSSSTSLSPSSVLDTLSLCSNK